MDRYNKNPRRPPYEERGRSNERVERQEEKGISNEIIEDLGKLEASVDLVNKIIRSSKEFNIRSESSYRKIHDLFSDVLDSTLNMVTSGALKNQIDQAYLNLAKVKVIVEYQRARGQISPNIAQVLNGAIDKLEKQLNDVKGSNQPDLQGLRKLIENIRIVIDSFAVLAKR